MMGGYGLTEEFVVEDGVPKTRYGQLGLIRANKMPPVEVRFVTGPGTLPHAYGAKGMGEICLIPTAPAAAQAYYLRDGNGATRSRCGTPTTSAADHRYAGVPHRLQRRVGCRAYAGADRGEGGRCCGRPRPDAGRRCSSTPMAPSTGRRWCVRSWRWMAPQWSVTAGVSSPRSIWAVSPSSTLRTTAPRATGRADSRWRWTGLRRSTGSRPGQRQVTAP